MKITQHVDGGKLRIILDIQPELGLHEQIKSVAWYDNGKRAMHDLKDFTRATKILITKHNYFLCFSGTFLQCSFLLYPERQDIAINHYILSYSSELNWGLPPHERRLHFSVVGCD